MLDPNYYTIYNTEQELFLYAGELKLFNPSVMFAIGKYTEDDIYTLIKKCNAGPASTASTFDQFSLQCNVIWFHGITKFVAVNVNYMGTYLNWDDVIGFGR